MWAVARGLRRGLARLSAPGITYTGVDVSGPLLARRARAHPRHAFLEADCADGVPLADAYADVVAALGWLHWEARYATR